MWNIPFQAFILRGALTRSTTSEVWWGPGQYYGRNSRGIKEPWIRRNEVATLDLEGLPLGRGARLLPQPWVAMCEVTKRRLILGLKNLATPQDARLEQAVFIKYWRVIPLSPEIFKQRLELMRQQVGARDCFANHWWVLHYGRPAWSKPSHFQTHRDQLVIFQEDSL